MAKTDIEDKDPFVDVNPDDIPFDVEAGEDDVAEPQPEDAAEEEERPRQRKRKSGVTPETALVAPGEIIDRERHEFRDTITGLLGGGLIGHRMLRRNWGVIATIIFLTIIYVSNRYAADQEMIQISDLQRELEEVRYRALTHNSELTMRCRQSFVEEALEAAGDSTLTVSKEPPFIIRTGKQQR